MNLRPYGDRGLLVDLTSRAQRRALIAAWADRSDVEVVAGEQTVLLLAQSASTRRSVAAEVSEMPLEDAPVLVGRSHQIAVRYDGPDFAVVAEVWDCSVYEVARRHSEIAWTVEFVGFTPGFGYLVTDSDLPQMPRRESPRTRVPAGSVALATHYCGIYPHATPGGWQLIGSTEAVLFDATRSAPALLAAGDTVRFEPA